MCLHNTYDQTDYKNSLFGWHRKDLCNVIKLIKEYSKLAVRSEESNITSNVLHHKKFRWREIKEWKQQVLFSNLEDVKLCYNSYISHLWNLPRRTLKHWVLHILQKFHCTLFIDFTSVYLCVCVHKSNKWVPHYSISTSHFTIITTLPLQLPFVS